MRTFHEHEHKHDLHGITVIVETDGEETWVGRCDDIVDAGVILRDADVFRAGESEGDLAGWLARAGEVGVWPRHRRVLVPAPRVASVRRLAGD